MRRCLLFSTATLLCCGLSSFASAQFSWSSSPTPAPLLQLAQNSTIEVSQQVSNEAADVDDTSAKPSPFDLFSNEPVVSHSVSEPSSGVTNPTGIGLIESIAPVGNEAGSHSQVGPMAAGAPAASPIYNPPIDWISHQRRAPNHTAEHMMLQWCADGLWDNYAAERAAQCARQAQRMAGHHCKHCGHHAGHLHAARGVGHCGRAGCSQCDQAAAHSHQAGLAGHHATTPGVGSLASNYAQTQQAQTQIQAQQVQAQYAQTPLGPNGRPAPTELPPPVQQPTDTVPSPSSGKVAQRPFYFNR